MATWRCPHCGTLQGEGARCFLCQRSATSCGTCVNFRRSVVGGVGYCALDRAREPLVGEERRPCWTSALPEAAGGLFEVAAQGDSSPPTAVEPPPANSGRARRGLIELHPSPAARPESIIGR